MTSGTWTTSGPGNSSMGLSHATAWVVPGGTSTVIPLPAALPLLLAGLGAFGVVRQVKRKAS